MVRPGLASKLSTILSSTPRTLHIVNPSVEVLRAIVHETTTHETLPTLRIYAPETTYNETFTGYPLTATANELTDAHETQFREATITAPPALIFDNTIFLIIESYLIETEHRELSSDIQTLLSDSWEDTTKYTFDSPATSTLLNDLSKQFSTDVLLDAQTILHTLLSTPISLEQFLVLLAARNDITNAALSEYANTTPYTSSGSIGRARFSLDRLNIISVEKRTPTSLGRPTYSLALSDPERGLDELADQLQIADTTV